jgi:hypothetical protein
MFERRRALLNAAGVGYLLCGVLLSVTIGSVFYVSTRPNPYRAVRDWDRLLSLRADSVGALVLASLLLFAVAVAGLVLGVALAARAARLRPTSAALGGLFFTVAMLGVAVLAVWTGIVSPYAAVQYRATSDELHKHALLMEAYIGEHVIMLALWSFLGFAALGLYCLGRALRGERGWLPDVLRVAAALILLHLPVSLYVARESLLHDNYPRGLAALDQFLLWGGLTLATFFSARWLRAVGRTLPR